MSWQDTAAAVGTVGATTVALWLGLRAEHRAGRELASRTTAQGQRVAAWVEDRMEPGSGPYPLPVTRVYAVIQNASEEPVWNVTMYAVAIDEDDEGVDRGGIEAVELGVVPPGASVDRRLYRTPPDAKSPAPLAVQFQDNAGQWWARNEHGVLLRLKRRLPYPPLRVGGTSL